jgi:hypothetical protein
MAPYPALPTQYTPDSMSQSSSVPSSPIYQDTHWSYDNASVSPVSISFELPEVSDLTPYPAIVDEDLAFEVTDVDNEDDSLELDESDSPDSPMPGPKGRFMCPYSGCSKPPYGTPWSLTVHMNTHNGVRFPCTSCERLFGRYADRVRHQKSVHEGQRWRCDYCEK